MRSSAAATGRRRSTRSWTISGRGPAPTCSTPAARTAPARRAASTSAMASPTRAGSCGTRTSSPSTLRREVAKRLDPDQPAAGAGGVAPGDLLPGWRLLSADRMVCRRASVRRPGPELLGVEHRPDVLDPVACHVEGQHRRGDAVLLSDQARLAVDRALQD